MTEFLVAVTILMALGSVLLKGHLSGNVERYKKELAEMLVEKQKTAQMLRQTEAVLATVTRVPETVMPIQRQMTLAKTPVTRHQTEARRLPC